MTSFLVLATAGAGGDLQPLVSAMLASGSWPMTPYGCYGWMAPERSDVNPTEPLLLARFDRILPDATVPRQLG